MPGVDLRFSLEGRVPELLPRRVLGAAEALRRPGSGQPGAGHAGQPAHPPARGRDAAGGEAAVHRPDRGEPALHQPRWASRGRGAAKLFRWETANLLPHSPVPGGGINLLRSQVHAYGMFLEGREALLVRDWSLGGWRCASLPCDACLCASLMKAPSRPESLVCAL